jgi:hypothetical protein
MPNVLRASPPIFPNRFRRKSNGSVAAFRLSGRTERQHEMKVGTPFMGVVANLSKTQVNANCVLLSLPKTIGHGDAHNAVSS